MYNLSKIVSCWLIAVVLVGADLEFRAAPPVPIDDYWQRVETTHTLVAGLSGQPAQAVSDQLESAADEWIAITAVALPDGSVVPVDHSFLASQLRADPPELERLEALLNAIRLAHRAWPAPRHTGGDLRLLSEILARPEFQWQAPQLSPLDQLWERLREALLRLLVRLFPDEWVVSLQAGFLGNCLTGLAALALLLILLYVGRSLLISLAPEAEAGPQDGLEETLTVEAALKRAQTLSTGGDYRAAVRYLYLSALLMLDEHGVLRYDRSLTNREYLRTVAHLAGVSAILREVIEVFDRVWYGYQPLDQAGYEHYAARVAELRRQR